MKASEVIGFMYLFNIIITLLYLRLGENKTILKLLISTLIGFPLIILELAIGFRIYNEDIFDYSMIFMTVNIIVFSVIYIFILTLK